MTRNMYLLFTGSIIIIALFIITSLGKIYLKKQCEPFVIHPMEDNDVLLDDHINLKLKNTTYRKSSKQWNTSPISSYEQTTNNQIHILPDNGSITLPELSGFYN
jgi:hypothetical protein